MICVLIALLLIALVVFIEIVSNPLRRPPERIREDLLKVTPIGMDMEEVIQVIESNKKWELGNIVYQNGYGMDKWGTPGGSGDTIIGEKYIWAIIDEYRNYFIIIVDVSAFWGFDEESKLIDIAVRKDGDTL